MIIFVPLNGNPIEYYESYTELFDAITPLANPLNWHFTIHPSHQVAALYGSLEDPAIREAFRDHLPLLEIVRGDVRKSLYVPLTANTDINYFQKNWCLDFCTYQDILVKEL